MEAQDLFFKDERVIEKQLSKAGLWVSPLYQLEAFFRIASTALPMVFVAGLCPYPKGTWQDRPPTEQRDRTLVGLVLMFSALLSVLGIPILFLYLGSLPPLLFQGTPLHP